MHSTTSIYSRIQNLQCLHESKYLQLNCLSLMPCFHMQLYPAIINIHVLSGSCHLVFNTLKCISKKHISWFQTPCAVHLMRLVKDISLCIVSCSPNCPWTFFRLLILVTGLVYFTPSYLFLLCFFYHSHALGCTFCMKNGI